MTISLRVSIDLLRRAPFFEGFAEDQLRLLAFSAETRSMAAEEILCTEGDELDAAYVVATAGLEARPAKGGNRRLKAGALIGEMALLVRAQAHETIVTVEAGDVVQIRRATMLRLLEEYPEFAQILRSRLARRLVGTARQLRGIADRLDQIEV
ncbi:Crp/Fnr family transcriptional regulator [Propylenella binzhouense]|uniref:Cyclic nucleotide-binding domain-containing protein n=1 Tax=Propylenella binzhouense TaxID=2555902 RepID=A0A964T1Q7_9HYPH|nr:cyclic nucleotide-binding domain-containing protein [Propylenella binzhouense]MYZ46841.1 cyclic nucleotide-binding domain-containing protein [Propylenella binzhouense]